MIGQGYATRLWSWSYLVCFRRTWIETWLTIGGAVRLLASYSFLDFLRCFVFSHSILYKPFLLLTCNPQVSHLNWLLVTESSGEVGGTLLGCGVEVTLTLSAVGGLELKYGWRLVVLFVDDIVTVLGGFVNGLLLHIELSMGDGTSRVVCLLCFAEGEWHASGGPGEGEIEDELWNDWFVFGTQVLFWFLVTEAAKNCESNFFQMMNGPVLTALVLTQMTTTF